MTLEETLKKVGFAVRKVSGDSMMPMLDQHTDLVKLVPASGELKKGDLPLYRRDDGQYVLHRIIRVKKNCYLTRGDNRREIEHIPKSSVVAVTVGFFKRGRYITVDDSGYLSYVNDILMGRSNDSDKLYAQLFLENLNGNKTLPEVPDYVSWSGACRWFVMWKVVGQVIEPLKTLKNPPYDELMNELEIAARYEKSSDLSASQDGCRTSDYRNGSTSVASVGNSGRLRKRLREFILHFFPTVDTMKRLFPVLYRKPYLLPVCYVIRWKDIVLSR